MLVVTCRGLLQNFDAMMNACSSHSIHSETKEKFFAVLLWGVRVSVDNPLTYFWKICSHIFLVPFISTKIILLPFPYLALKISFNGSANCKFEDSIESKFFEKDVIFTGHAKYISHSSYLFGTSMSDLQEFKVGSYEYPFWYNIPHNLPSTVKGKHGKIRYHVEASLQTGWKFDLFARETFSIIRIEDLSQRSDKSQLMMPISDESSTTFCCWTCTTRPLYFKVSIPFSGYISDQIIRVTVFIRNNCGFDVSSTIISLNKAITSVSQQPERREYRETKQLTQTIESGAPSGKSSSKILSEIRVPKFTLPSSTCDIVRVSYFVQVALDVVGFIRSPKIKIPIVIGTRALKFENNMNLMLLSANCKIK